MMKTVEKFKKTSNEEFRSRMGELDLTAEQLVEMFATMSKIRHFERMADRLYAAGKVHGTMHLSAGQEAVAFEKEAVPWLSEASLPRNRR